MLIALSVLASLPRWSSFANTNFHYISVSTLRPLPCTPCALFTGVFMIVSYTAGVPGNIGKRLETRSHVKPPEIHNYHLFVPQKILLTSKCSKKHQASHSLPFSPSYPWSYEESSMSMRSVANNFNLKELTKREIYGPLLYSSLSRHNIPWLFQRRAS